MGTPAIIFKMSLCGMFVVYCDLGTN